MSQFGLTLVHPDPRVEARAFEKLQSLVRIAGRLKCQINIGLFRGPALEGKPIARTRDRFVEVLKGACDVAARHDVFLSFEPTNRFEINFINTTDEGLDIVRRVNRPNLGLLLDLYHMYLEDPDIMDSIWKARHVVRHFHFSDSDRWPAGLGHGTFDFRVLVGLVKAIGYQGFLSEGLVPMENVDEAARTTAAFLRRMLSG
jgi:sugar phosphate isomerase/epimerase